MCVNQIPVRRPNKRKHGRFKGGVNAAGETIANFIPRRIMPSGNEFEKQTLVSLFGEQLPHLDSISLEKQAKVK